jgi:hypothetical protein
LRFTLRRLIGRANGFTHAPAAAPASGPAPTQPGPSPVPWPRLPRSGLICSPPHRTRASPPRRPGLLPASAYRGPARNPTSRPHNCGAALPYSLSLHPPCCWDTLAPDQTTLASQTTRLRARQPRSRPRASTPIPCARPRGRARARSAPHLPHPGPTPFTWTPGPSGWTNLPAGPHHPAGTPRWLRRQPALGPSAPDLT